MAEQRNEGLAVSLVRLTNIGGIEGTLEVPISDITYLEGDNGVGKSSALNGIAALCGDSVGDLLNQGAEEGEAYLELTDGTWFRRVIDAGGKNEISAGHPDTGPISRAAGWLRATLAAAALSPAEFLSADDQAAAEHILRAAPLTVTEEELREALGDEIEVPDVDLSAHALTVLDRAVKTLYGARREENRVAKEARTTAEQLARSVPEGAADPAELEGRVEALEEEMKEVQQEGEAAKAEAETDARSQVDAEIATLDGEIEEHGEDISRLEAELTRARIARDAATKRRTEIVKRRDAAAEEAASRAAAPWREKYSALDADLRAARQELASAQQSAAAVENTRAMIRSQEKKAEAAHARSQELTKAMARLDALRVAKAAGLPVEGVSIEDGRLQIGGVPAHRANTAERIRVALDASAAQGARVQFVFADRLESLSTKTRQQVERACRERGIHLLGARVTDDEELTIRSPDPDEAEEPEEVSADA